MDTLNLVAVILVVGIPLIVMAFIYPDKKAYDKLHQVCEDQEKEIEILKADTTQLNEVVEIQRRRNDLLVINLGNTIDKLQSKEDELQKYLRPRNELGQFTKKAPVTAEA